MRKFSSYGPVSTNLHFYVPREALVQDVCAQLMGASPEEGGHYLTVWAPRQSGKTWVMNQALKRLWKDARFHSLQLVLEDLKYETDVLAVLRAIGQDIQSNLKLKPFPIQSVQDFSQLFLAKTLKKPLILILDEFDALADEAISALVSLFRKIHLDRSRSLELGGEGVYALHGVALVGIRGVLGVENVRGSPFNVQRSVHIPNLTKDETVELFRFYERERGQRVDPLVVDRIYQEVKGQPGLTCWLGELLTETYNAYPENPITVQEFENAYLLGTRTLPNNNILNLISKARQEPYRSLVLACFETVEKQLFAYDDPLVNFLYLNGVFDHERMDNELYTRFASPLVQKRLFQYFARDLIEKGGELISPNQNVKEIAGLDTLNIPKLMKLYQAYLLKNRNWLFKDVPRRKDLRVFEAVYHFNLYSFLERFFMQIRRGKVIPEFPTGNGRIDLLLRYQAQIYGLELKSYTSEWAFEEAQKQAGEYGKRLGIEEIYLVCFVTALDEENRSRLGMPVIDKESGIRVCPLFVETGVDGC